MNYSAEIADVMQQLSHLNKEMGARKKNGERNWELEKRRRELERREDELGAQAAKAFPDLNGWRVSRRFMLETLIKGRARDGWKLERASIWQRDLFDHPEFFRENQRPHRAVAIVGQPYSHVEVETARDRARELGLDLHVPGKINASWHYPNYTRFFCITRPGTAVQFLPEQIS
jgi:hypothetical protein